MPKAKLKIAKTDLKKLKVAANFSGVKLGDGISAGNNVITEVNFRNPADLVELGRYMETVAGTELDAAADAAAEAAKKATGKK